MDRKRAAQVPGSGRHSVGRAEFEVQWKAPADAFRQRAQLLNLYTPTDAWRRIILHAVRRPTRLLLNHAACDQYHSVLRTSQQIRYEVLSLQSTQPKAGLAARVGTKWVGPESEGTRTKTAHGGIRHTASRLSSRRISCLTTLLTLESRVPLRLALHRTTGLGG